MKQFGNKMDVLLGIGLAVVVIVLTLLGSFCDFMLAIANTKGFVWIQIDNVTVACFCLLTLIGKFLGNELNRITGKRIQLSIGNCQTFSWKNFDFFHWLKRTAYKFQVDSWGQFMSENSEKLQIDKKGRNYKRIKRLKGQSGINEINLTSLFNRPSLVETDLTGSILSTTQSILGSYLSTAFG